MELILCRVVESFCSPTHNIVPRISWHDLLCHMTMKRYSDFPSMVIFQLLRLKFWIETWFCNCQQYPCLFHIVFEYIPRYTWSRNDVGSPKSTSLFSTFHIGSMFCFFPANLMSSTYRDKNNPFWRCTNKHSQLETFSQPCCNRIFLNCFSHNSPAKGWPYRFHSRGTTGSSTLDHDLGHLCFGRRIQMSGHSNFGIFNNVGASISFELLLNGL